MDLPDEKERERFIHMMLEKTGHHKFVSDEMIHTMSQIMVGQSCSYIDQVIQYAIRQTVMKQMDEKQQGSNSQLYLTDEILKDSVQEFMNGERNSQKLFMSTAIHEAGHAFMTWKSGEIPTFMTIASRGGYGGYVQHQVDHDKQHFTRQEYLDKIKIALAGRASEIVFYGEEEGVNTGASSDLEQATYYAIQIVSRLGMQKNQLAVIPSSMMHSELSAEVIAQANTILLEQMEECIKIIQENQAVVKALADSAMVKTQLIEAEIKSIIEETIK